MTLPVRCACCAQAIGDPAGRDRPRGEAQMRFYRISFLGGLALGYVLGAQAGRERYEQLKQLARKAAESPAMQQTAGALQAQAQALVGRSFSSLSIRAARTLSEIPGLELASGG